LVFARPADARIFGHVDRVPVEPSVYTIVCLPTGYTNDPLSQSILSAFGTDPTLIALRRSTCLQTYSADDPDFRHRFAHRLPEVARGKPVILVVQGNQLLFGSAGCTPQQIVSDLHGDDVFNRISNRHGILGRFRRPRQPECVDGVCDTKPSEPVRPILPPIQDERPILQPTTPPQPSPGPAGPPGPQGPAGPQGPPGTDATAADVQKLQAEIDALKAAQADQQKINADVVSSLKSLSQQRAIVINELEQLKADLSKPINFDDVAAEVSKRLPPVKLEWETLDGQKLTQQKPLGEPLRIKSVRQGQ
jgi:hypothetical protein